MHPTLVTPEQKQENAYLKDLAPLLFNDALRRETRAPSGYFETLHDRIVERSEPLSPTQIQKDHVRWPWINYRNIAIAAGLALILGLLPWIHTRTDLPLPLADPIAVAAEIFRAQSPQELTDFAYHIDEKLLIQSIDPNILSMPGIPDGISDRELIEYLIYSGVSVEMIYSTHSNIIHPQNHKQ